MHALTHTSHFFMAWAKRQGRYLEGRVGGFKATFFLFSRIKLINCKKKDEKNRRKARKMKNGYSYFCTVQHLGFNHHSRLCISPAACFLTVALTASICHTNPSPPPFPSPTCPTGKKTRFTIQLDSAYSLSPLFTDSVFADLPTC